MSDFLAGGLTMEILDLGFGLKITCSTCKSATSHCQPLPKIANRTGKTNIKPSSYVSKECCLN